MVRASLFLVVFHFFGLTTNYWTTCVYAQANDTVVAFAKYKFVQRLDVKNYEEEMLLLLTPSSSLYLSQDNIMQKKALQSKSAESIVLNGSVKAEVSRYTSSNRIYHYPEDRKLLVIENLVLRYLYEDDYPLFSWEISSDEKTILGLRCQSATSFFMGRKWIVWFCPDLPFNSGPWKLSGLPGLVLEAKDLHGEVSFSLEDFVSDKLQVSNLEPNLKTIVKPEPVKIGVNRIPLIAANKKDVKRLWAAFHKNKEAFVSAQIDAANGIIYDPVSLESLFVNPLSDKPIELDGNAL